MNTITQTAVNEFLEVASSLSGVSLAAIQSTTQSLLAREGIDLKILPGQSALNNDGSPLQLCITAKGNQFDIRLIGDPAYEMSDRYQRVRRSIAVLNQLLQFPGLESMIPAFDSLLRYTLPQGVEGCQELEVGGLWIASGLGVPGIAAYTTSWWGSEASHWERALQWLNHLLPHPGISQTVIRHLRTVAKISSTGLEGRSLKDARAKIYFRLAAPTALQELGIPLLGHPLLSAFLTDALQQRALPLSGLVLSMGFSVASGEIADVKVDLCGCQRCLAQSGAGWLDLLTDLTRQYELTLPPLREPLLRGMADVAFLGMGLDSRYQPRLNVYLKATG